MAVCKKKILSHNARCSLLKQLDQLIRYASKDKDAYANLLLLYSAIDIDALIQFSTHLNKNQFQRFAEAINPNLIAQKSLVQIEVRRHNTVTGRLKTNGRYVLYFKTAERSIHVKFAHRTSFVVYLMYLIDKCRSCDADTLSLDKSDFERLMQTVYAISGEQPPKRMKDCLWDINNAIRTTCRTLGVPPSPYIINGEHEHLYALPQDISVPSELL